MSFVGIHFANQGGKGLFATMACPDTAYRRPWEKAGLSTMTSIDRRSCQRWRGDDLTAWLSLPGDRGSLRCRVVNASSRGALLETSASLAAGTDIELAFERADHNRPGRLFRRSATVVRRTPTEVAVTFRNAWERRGVGDLPDSRAQPA
jgi:hypothetical protein